MHSVSNLMFVHRFIAFIFKRKILKKNSKRWVLSFQLSTLLNVLSLRRLLFRHFSFALNFGLNAKLVSIHLARCRKFQLSPKLNGIRNYKQTANCLWLCCRSIISIFVKLQKSSSLQSSTHQQLPLPVVDIISPFIVHLLFAFPEIFCNVQYLKIEFKIATKQEIGFATNWAILR